MRPRFMNRGSPLLENERRKLYKRGFNEAPIHESGKSSVSIPAQSSRSKLQ